MMDVICCMRCAGALLILLYVQASLVHAEPKSKAELGHRNAKLRVQTSVMMASNRRNNLRRKTGAQASPPVSSMSLADYKMEITRKMTQVRTPLEFLRVFFPADTVKNRWTNMVNESVQNAWRAGRTETDAERPNFTAATANQLLEEVQSHGKNISCGEPKLVLIDMYEELNLTRGSLVYLYPECTMVRRCEGSGCCSGGAPCVGKANTRENISRPFMVVRVIPDETIKGESNYIRHSLYADTECVCKERPLTPRCPVQECSDTMRFDEVLCRCVCTKRCPKPYQQNEETCDCHCADKDGGCNKIKRARRRLLAAECRCVMDQLCLQPACKKGYSFNTFTCKCSQTDASKRREANRNNRNGRTDNQPYPPRSGRTDVNPSQSYGSESEPQPVDPYSSHSEGQVTRMIEDELLVTWESEDVTPDSCHGPACIEPLEAEIGSGANGN
ncbi:uncharacterized protein LOC117293184 [Asterias rubens]|uniref:uncharacterized protein LOC117293184 n=1 Tax=Asterias rubens TaxID=7604 RepID=UPI0014551733|nr:uncharacterized protein LOC117293184 [Asterias rubens]